MSEGGAGGQGAEPGQGAARPCPALQKPVRGLGGIPEQQLLADPGSWDGRSGLHNTRAAEVTRCTFLKVHHESCFFSPQPLLNLKLDLLELLPWYLLTDLQKISMLTRIPFAGQYRSTVMF